MCDFGFYLHLWSSFLCFQSPINTLNLYVNQLENEQSMMTPLGWNWWLNYNWHNENWKLNACCKDQKVEISNYESGNREIISHPYHTFWVKYSHKWKALKKAKYSETPKT